MRWLLLLLLMLAPPARAQEGDDDDDSSIEIETEEPADERDEAPSGRPARGKLQRTVQGKFALLTDSKGHFRLRVPADWKVEETGFRKQELALEARIPGLNRTTRITINLVENQAEARGCVAGVQRWARQQDPVRSAQPRSEPVPHIVVPGQGSPPNSVHVQAFPTARGRTIRVVLFTHPDDLDTLLAPFLEVARTVDSDRPDFPEIPAGYKVTTKRGFRYAVHPDVKSKPTDLMRIAGTVGKRIEQLHGKPPAGAKALPTPVVFVHQRNRDARDLAPWMPKRPESSVMGESALELFVTPINPEDERHADRFARSVALLLLQRRYGSTMPRWMRFGERGAARVEFGTGRKLPAIDQRFLNWAGGVVIPRLDVMENDPEHWPAVRSQQAFLYVAMFRSGPAKYRKAYRAFQRELTATLDPTAAMRKHLEPLDYDKLQAAATRFMTDGFKVVKAKR